MIKHILADGTKLDSIEGIIIPASGDTEAVYRILDGFAKRRAQATNKAKEERTHAETT